MLSRRRSRHGRQQSADTIARLTVERRDLLAEITLLRHHAAAIQRENDAQRDIIAAQGRQLLAARRGPLGDEPTERLSRVVDTQPLPRVRSLTAAGAVLPFPPEEWTR